MYGDWEKQLGYIAYLDQHTNVTPDDYHNFHYNDSFIGSFKNTSEYNTRITPSVIVPHWTAHRYPPGLAGGALFATGLTSSGLSSNYFIDHSGEAVYRYYDEDNPKNAAALGMNKFAVNIKLRAQIAMPTPPTPTAP